MNVYKNSGFAGEMLVAAELARRGYEVLIGNVGAQKTRGVDLAAVVTDTGCTVSISVKSLKAPNTGGFPIDPEKILAESVYVFVMTGGPGELPEFYVLRGKALLNNEDQLFGKWGRSYVHKGFRGIPYKRLAKPKYRDNWQALEDES